MWYAKNTKCEMFISALHIQIPFYVTVIFCIICLHICCTFLWATSRKSQWSVKQQNHLSIMCVIIQASAGTVCHLIAFKLVTSFLGFTVTFFDRCFLSMYCDYFPLEYFRLKRFMRCKEFLLLFLSLYYFCVFQWFYQLLLFQNHEGMNLVKTGT